MKQRVIPSQIIARTNAFTIIELLVVIGIISILAIALLVSLNPADAQRRARDAQRIKDINSLQSVVEQYLNDGGALPSACNGSPTICISNRVGGTGAANSSSAPQACSSNWLNNMDVCNFARTVPVDPTNNATRTCVTGIGTTTKTGCVMRYRFIISGSNYEFSTMLESTTNSGKAGNDGGVNDTDVGGVSASLYQIWSNGELTVNTYRSATPPTCVGAC